MLASSPLFLPFSSKKNSTPPLSPSGAFIDKRRLPSSLHGELGKQMASLRRQEQQATPSLWTSWERTWGGERPNNVELRLVRRVLQVDLRDASGKCRMPFLLELTADKLFSWGRNVVVVGNAKWAAEVICMGETWPMLFVQCHLERGKPTCMTLQKKKKQLGILLKTWWLDASHGRNNMDGRLVSRPSCSCLGLVLLGKP